MNYINHSDAVFLSHQMDTFLEFVADPQAYFDRFPDPILPKSFDHYKLAMALHLLGECYFRSKGLKLHPRSKTEGQAMDALLELIKALTEEVKVRPHMYPALSGVLGRGEAAIEMDLILQGFKLEKGEEGDE